MWRPYDPEGLDVSRLKVWMSVVWMSGWFRLEVWMLLVFLRSFGCFAFGFTGLVVNNKFVCFSGVVFSVWGFGALNYRIWIVYPSYMHPVSKEMGLWGVGKSFLGWLIWFNRTLWARGHEGTNSRIHEVTKGREHEDTSVADVLERRRRVLIPFLIVFDQSFCCFVDFTLGRAVWNYLFKIGCVCDVRAFFVLTSLYFMNERWNFLIPSIWVVVLCLLIYFIDWFWFGFVKFWLLIF